MLIVSDTFGEGDERQRIDDEAVLAAAEGIGSAAIAALAA
jgi:hypothetical protein